MKIHTMTVSTRLVVVTLGLMLACAQGASAVGGFLARSDNPFMFGIVQVSVDSAVWHVQWACTGTLVSSTMVLTSRWCSGPAGDTSVSMQNTQAGTSQTSTVREVIAHPSQDLALLLLSTPMTPANRNLFPEVATLRPTNNTSVICNGFGGGNHTVLHDAPFGVGGSGSNYTVSSSINTTQIGDEGGPCYDSSLGSNGVQRLVGVLSTPWSSPAGVSSGVGIIGTGAAGEAEQDTVQQWIVDMIHLDMLKWGHYSYSIINKRSGKAFDVADASLLPNTAVNQFHLNGGLNQNWYYEYTNYPFMRIVSAQSGKCLDVDGNNQLRQSTCSSSTTQLFRITYVDNTYANVLAYGGRVVDVPWASTDDQVRLQVYPWNGGDNQLWYFGIH